MNKSDKELLAMATIVIADGIVTINKTGDELLMTAAKDLKNLLETTVELETDKIRGLMLYILTIITRSPQHLPTLNKTLGEIFATEAEKYRNQKD